MLDQVDLLYADLRSVSSLLREKEEISLGISLDDLHRKALLLAAASYFEVRLAQDVQDFCDEIAGAGSPVSSLVAAKAIKRQYHTWFDWEKPNANKFFSMFGEGFKKWMDKRQQDDTYLVRAINAFMLIGSDRNRLVHQNFGAFSLESTPDEIMTRYKSALSFVQGFKKNLQDYQSEKSRTAVEDGNASASRSTAN
jgi:hypothetical protein